MDNAFYDEATLKKREKKKIKATLAGICCMLVGSYLCVIAASLLAGVVSFLTSGMGLQKSGVVREIFDALIYVFQLGVPALFYMLVTQKSFAECVSPKIDDNTESFGIIKIIVFALAAFSMSCTMSALSSIFTQILGLDSAAFDIPVPESGAAFALNFISVAILPAFLEEFLFRGIILSSLLPYGKTFAIVASAIFFASVHGSAEQIMYAFVYGIILAYITVKTGNLLPALIIHFLNNAYSCVFGYLENIYDSESFLMLSNIVYLLLFATGLLCTAYIFGKNKLALKESRKNPLRTRESLSLLISPIMIIYYLLVLFETLYVYLG